MDSAIDASRVTVVLMQPRYPENIGAAARAMCNMGFSDLIVVDPRNCDLTKVLRMATHAAVDVVERMAVYDDLPTALKPFQLVVGTTARRGKHRTVIESPAKLARQLGPITPNNRVALLFGPEDRGLTNEDLRRCHWLVHIPTAEFSSLNLAQAVMIVCYELFQAGRSESKAPAPRLAARHELDGMYEQVKDILVRIDFIKPDNPDYWMDKVRHFFTRLQLRAGEVSIIRGVCRQIDWYARHRYERGLAEGKKIASNGSES